MSNNNFSRRRRGMRFKPKGGLNPAHQKPDREAVEARADVVSEQGGADRLFEKRHGHEIERAENLAAGLPPEGAPPSPAPGADNAPAPDGVAAPAPVEEKFEPVRIPEPPCSLTTSARASTASRSVFW